MTLRNWRVDGQAGRQRLCTEERASCARMGKRRGLAGLARIAAGWCLDGSTQVGQAAQSSQSAETESRRRLLPRGAAQGVLIPGAWGLQGMSTPCALRRGAPVGRATLAGAPPASASKRADRLPPPGRPPPSITIGARPPLLRAAPRKGLASTPLVGMCEGGRPLQRG